MRKAFIVLNGVLLILVLFSGGCGDEDSSDTLCGPCESLMARPTQGTCSDGEVCRLAEGGGTYCFEVQDDGTIDGICG